MRILAPFTWMHDAAEMALREWAPEAERVDVSASLTSYWELMATVWGLGESFAVIEHDIEIHEHVIRSFAACPELWCVFPYPYRGSPQLLTSALGCARFHDQLLREQPRLLGDFDEDSRYWRDLDRELSHELEGLGYQAHVHWPPVGHHDERRTRSPAERGPWRKATPAGAGATRSRGST